MRKRILWISTLLVVAGVVAVVWLYADWMLFFTRPILRGRPKTSIKVKQGATLNDVKDALRAQRLLHHPEIFSIYAHYRGYQKRIRFGQYKITADMTAPELLQNIATGRGLLLHRVTFIEGWTFEQMRKKLLKNANLRHTLADRKNKDIMRELGAQKTHPEGLFFPDTYQFTWGNSDLDVLRQAHAKMQRFMKEQWPLRAKGLPYQKPYQALIVASLIEKETSLEKERSLVAGVILRRLKHGMRLQVDPTVLYGVGKPYGSTITKRDLKAKNPYNTYQRYGLPPTPIGMPSKASILAALHPTGKHYLYYVARGDGSHIFSTTYREHLRAVRQYREMLRRQRQQQNQWRRALLDVAMWVFRFI